MRLISRKTSSAVARSDDTGAVVGGSCASPGENESARRKSAAESVETGNGKRENGIWRFEKLIAKSERRWVDCMTLRSDCGLTIGPLADYHESCASKPGDRCPIRGSASADWHGWGRGKSELRRAVCSLTARVGGGCPTCRAVRRRHGKCHRKYTARQPTGKGEKVRSRVTGLNVRAHRPDGDVGGRENPTRSKTK